MIDEATAGDEAMDAHVPERREFLKTGVGFASAVALATFGGGLATAASATSQRGADGAGRTRRALVINAHQHYPGISEGRLNQTLSRVIRKRLESKGYEVQVTEIASGYDIQAEVEKHLWADVIVTQSPVFWFGNPWIYKRYVDEVFTAGMMQQSFLSGDGRSRSDPSRQYGSGGKMQGKRYMLSLTMNSPKAAFDDDRQHLHKGLSLDEVFASNTANYRFCGAEILPVFACYDVVSAADVDNDLKRLASYMDQHFS